MLRIAIYPKNDAADLVEIRQNPHSFTTGGSRINPHPGVPHYPSNHYPQDSFGSNLVPSEGVSSKLPSGTDSEEDSEVKKIIILKSVAKKSVLPEDFVKRLKHTFGKAISIDFDNRKLISKKYPSVPVFGILVTLASSEIDYFENLFKKLEIPYIILGEEKKTAGLQKLAFDISVLHYGNQ